MLRLAYVSLIVRDFPGKWEGRNSGESRRNLEFTQYIVRYFSWQETSFYTESGFFAEKKVDLGF
jgi:hypothetical protein